MVAHSPLRTALNVRLIDQLFLPANASMAWLKIAPRNVKNVRVIACSIQAGKPAWNVQITAKDVKELKMHASNATMIWSCQMESVYVPIIDFHYCTKRTVDFISSVRRRWTCRLEWRIKRIPKWQSCSRLKPTWMKLTSKWTGLMSWSIFISKVQRRNRLQSTNRLLMGQICISHFTFLNHFARHLELHNSKK